jgi:hypothetical protein
MGTLTMLSHNNTFATSGNGLNRRSGILASFQFFEIFCKYLFSNISSRLFVRGGFVHAYPYYRPNAPGVPAAVTAGEAGEASPLFLSIFVVKFWKKICFVFHDLDCPEGHHTTSHRSLFQPSWGTTGAQI